MASSLWAACVILPDSIPWAGSIGCCCFSKKLTSSGATNIDGRPHWDVPTSASREWQAKGMATMLILHYDCAGMAFLPAEQLWASSRPRETETYASREL